MIDVDLHGRTALVTGSAKGLGREVALSLASSGANLAIHYHTSEDEALEVADEADSRGSPEVITVQADVTDPNAVTRTFDEIEANIGTVELLVNNVGRFAPTHWEEIDIETWKSVMDTNLNATYLCCRRAVPAMREHGFGRIINIGYAGADRALVYPKNAPYFIAKTGITMFTRMLAADTQDDDITANVVAPYVIENSDRFPSSLPQDRPAQFEEIIQAVMFFLEPTSGYISGQHLAVDGGWLPERV